MKNNHKTLNIIKQNIVPFIVITAGFIFLVWLFGSPTRCYFKMTTGVPCPSCGMTRSYIHAFHGEWHEAFHDHPLFLTVPFIFAGAYYTMVQREATKLRRWVIGLMMLLIIAFVVVYIVRMVLYFPHTEPMQFYEDGIIPSLFRKIKDVFH